MILNKLVNNDNFSSATPSFNIESLKIFLNDVLKMGRISQGMFYRFKESYFEKNKVLSEDVINQEDRVDFLESKLEYDFMKLMLLNNFSGLYLKSSIVGLKLLNIFENIGDLCEENCKLNIELLKLPQKINILSFEDLFVLTQNSLTDSLKIFSEFINIERIVLTSEEKIKDIFNESEKICTINNELKSLNIAYKKYLLKSKENLKSINLHIEMLNKVEKISELSTNIIEVVLWALTDIKYKCRGNSLEYFYSQDDEI